MRRAGPTLLRCAYAVALALGLAALALALQEWVLVLPLGVCAALAVATPFLEWVNVPESLTRLLPRAHALALFVGGVIVWLSRSMGVLALAPEAIVLVAGPFLVPVWLAFALAPRAFPARRTLLPGIVALLAFAGLNPLPPWYGRSRLPFLAGGERNGFAEIYLGLAMATVVVLWTAELVSSGPRWSRRALAAVALSGALAVALAAGGVIGLPLMQPHVERAFASVLDQATTGLSDGSRLGDIGALSVSRRRVLDLQTSPPSGGHWLLPSEVFTHFDGRQWTNTAPEGQPIVLRPGSPPVAAGPIVADLGAWFPGPEAPATVRPGAGVRVPVVQMRVTQAEVADWPLLLPRGVVAVTASTSYLGVDRFRLVRRPTGLPLRQYGAVVAAPSVSPAAGDELSPEERADSLSLPSAVDPRIVSLAQRLAAPSADARRRLEATVHHLQTRYRYTLSPGRFRPDGDPLAEFLFEKKAAYCEYFATAAVVLLRLQGVPARFVKGLSVGPQADVGGGLYVVRESDAHAWIEAWVPGEGWVEADPTPPGQFETARGAPDRWQRWYEHVRAAMAGAWRRLTEAGPTAFLRWAGGALVSVAGRLVFQPLVWLLGAVVALGPRLVRRLRRLRLARRVADRERAAVPADLQALVRRLERLWTAQGRPRPPGHGLLEHAASLREGSAPGRALPPDPLVESSDRIVRLYYRARFGGETPAPEEVRSLQDAL